MEILIFSEGLHDWGQTNLQTHVIYTGDAKPVLIPFYRQNQEISRKTDEMVSDMLNTGLIKGSNSEWYSPVVLVKKANTQETGEYCFAVDYRKLNKVTKPIPLTCVNLYLSGRCR